jgi:high-affinity K+ transport system ATPase subunit B
MKQWKIGLITLTLVFFANHSAVFAHEGEGKSTDNYLKDFSTNEHDHSVTEEEITDSHDSHDMGESIHDEAGEHGTFDGEETGPNIIVLSSFATVNAVFLLIGIWNKWRKRGTKYGIN